MKDNLARNIYAEKIATEIAEHYDAEKQLVQDGKKKEQENIVFAVSGKWGEGKTALLKLVEGPLVKKGFTVIWFNPWKYSQEDITLKRAFLGSLKTQLGSHADLDDLYYDRTKTTLNFDWRFVVRWSLICSFFYFLILPSVFGLSIFDWLTASTGTLSKLLELPLIKPLLTLILIPIVLEIITISRRGANVSTAEEFEGKFIDLLADKKKIVIFVDDLDRCTPKTVKVILDSLRTFFQHPECSYIITGDHTVVERYAGDELELPEGTSQPQKLQEGRRFLKKLFDVYWRLPLPTPYQFSIFVDEELKTSKIVLNDVQSQNLKGFVIDDGLFERNPRHVKRFFTKLRFALEGVSLQIQELEKEEKAGNQSDAKTALKDILGSPDLLAKVLLIEEFFYPVYEKLILNPEDLVHHEKSLRNSLETTELRVGLKTVIELLDNKSDELEKYASLVKKLPKFTDENNSTVHEVANFLSFSGSTGLPSTLGPDEANFEQYLRAGQLADKLGKILEVSKSEKKEQFVEKSISMFSVATDIEKPIVLGEALKLSVNIGEWSQKLAEWKKELLSLPPATQEPLVGDFWTAVIQKKPELINPTGSEKLIYLDSLWNSVESTDISLLHKNLRSEMQKVIEKLIAQRPPLLKGLEVFLNKFGETTNQDLETQLIDPAACKVFLDATKNEGIEEGIVAGLIKKKLSSYLNDFSNIDWFIANKEYLKTLKIFETAKANVKKWIKDLKQFQRITELQDSLELDEGDKRAIRSEVITLIKKSANLEFINQPNTYNLLNKEDKQKSFEALKDILKSSDDSMEKRKQSADLLIKPSAIWGGVEKDDVYQFLKEIKKLKLGKIAELKDKPKEILDSWGFEDEKSKSSEVDNSTTQS